MSHSCSRLPKHRVTAVDGTVGLTLKVPTNCGTYKRLKEKSLLHVTETSTQSVDRSNLCLP